MAERGWLFSGRKSNYNAQMLGILSTVVAVGSLIAAIVAALLSRQSNKASKEANLLANKANWVAERALQLQEDDARLRLSVKPRMMCVLGDGEDPEPRPVVEVVNLSSFPVTIVSIHWKTDRAEKPWLFWKNPTISHPFDMLPARLPLREALTAVGIPTTFASTKDLLAVTAAVASTACGERIEGMTDDWLKHCEKVRNAAANV
jgi:hypothetical protein